MKLFYSYSRAEKTNIMYIDITRILTVPGRSYNLWSWTGVDGITMNSCLFKYTHTHRLYIYIYTHTHTHTHTTEACVLSYSVMSCSLLLMDCIAHQAPLSMGILQARILEWVAMPSSRGSSQPREQIQVFHIAGRFFNIWATRKAHTTDKTVQIMCVRAG